METTLPENDELPATLTDAEAARLEAFENIILEGQRTFVEVGEALLAIRSERLFRHSYENFNEYCEQVWGWGCKRASQLIIAAQVVKSLPDSTVVDCEGQARELAKVDPDKRVDVLQQAAEQGPVTARAIKAAASKRVAPVDEPVVPDVLDDPETRAYRVSLKLKALSDSCKEAVACLNPTRLEMIQAAVTFKKLAADLERSAAQLEN